MTNTKLYIEFLEVLEEKKDTLHELYSSEVSKMVDEHQLKLKDLYEYLGVSRSHFYLCMKGNRKFTMEQLKALSDYMDSKVGVIIE